MWPLASIPPPIAVPTSLLPPKASYGTVPATHSSRQGHPRAHWAFAVSRASLQQRVSHICVPEAPETMGVWGWDPPAMPTVTWGRAFAVHRRSRGSERVRITIALDMRVGSPCGCCSVHFGDGIRYSREPGAVRIGSAGRAVVSQIRAIPCWGPVPAAFSEDLLPGDDDAVPARQDLVVRRPAEMIERLQRWPCVERSSSSVRPGRICAAYSYLARCMRPTVRRPFGACLTTPRSTFR